MQVTTCRAERPGLAGRVRLVPRWFIIGVHVEGATGKGNGDGRGAWVARVSRRSGGRPWRACAMRIGARLLGLPPVLARHTRCLVLGSFPGAASLAAQLYYGHPRNHFWPLLSAIWQMDLVAMPYPRRLAEVRRRGLGIWDAYASCQRAGSLDSAIEAAELNDFAWLLRRAPAVRLVLHNGGESARVARAIEALGLPTRRLPSTSPANASWSFERKLSAWRDAFVAGGVA